MPFCTDRIDEQLYNVDKECWDEFLDFQVLATRQRLNKGGRGCHCNYNYDMMSAKNTCWAVQYGHGDRIGLYYLCAEHFNLLRNRCDIKQDNLFKKDMRLLMKYMIAYMDKADLKTMVFSKGEIQNEKLNLDLPTVSLDVD